MNNSIYVQMTSWTLLIAGLPKFDTKPYCVIYIYIYIYVQICVYVLKTDMNSNIDWGGGLPF